jgi:hypothetical protein
MGFKAWNINELAISQNAVPLDAGGYAEDEVASFEWDDDWFKKYTGADGEVTRASTNTFGGVLTLKYAQSADANDRLSALLKKDVLLPNGGGAGVLMLRDLYGRLVLTGPRAWIMGPPPLKMAKTVQVYEWKIDVADARGSFFGGR